MDFQVFFPFTIEDRVPPTYAHNSNTSDLNNSTGDMQCFSTSCMRMCACVCLFVRVCVKKRFSSFLYEAYNSILFLLESFCMYEREKLRFFSLLCVSVQPQRERERERERESFSFLFIGSHFLFVLVGLLVMPSRLKKARE